MPTSGFFGWVWRFNALAIAVAATSAIVAAALVVWSFVLPWRGQGGWRGETELVERGQDSAQEVKYALARGKEVEGTQYTLFELERYRVEATRRSFKPSYSDDTSTVNILLVDGRLATGRWMFEGVNQIVGVRDQIYDTASASAGKAKAVAMVVEIRSAVTNKDGTIEAGDGFELIAHRFDTGARSTLLKGSVSVAFVGQTEGGAILVMYEEGKKTVVATFDVNDFRPLAKNELPRLSTDPPRDHSAPDVTRVQ